MRRYLNTGCDEQTAFSERRVQVVLPLVAANPVTAVLYKFCLMLLHSASKGDLK
jgi:hypothetical protein